MLNEDAEEANGRLTGNHPISAQQDEVLSDRDLDVTNQPRSKLQMLFLSVMLIIVSAGFIFLLYHPFER